jgi:hypothetical protein
MQLTPAPPAKHPPLIAIHSVVAAASAAAAAVARLPDDDTLTSLTTGQQRKAEWKVLQVCTGVTVTCHFA